MDHELYDWSPLPARDPLRLPGGARLAVVLVVCLETVEWEPHEETAPPTARGAVYPRAFDPTLLSLHEYGNRVGVFRVFDVLDRLGLPATAAVDALVAERRGLLVEECSARSFCFVGRGLSASRMTTEQLGEADERARIHRCLGAVAQITGSAPKGWFGVGYGESSRTPALLAEAGVRYVCDWPNDEQPYTMGTPSERLVSLPVSVELDDVIAMRVRSLPVQQWGSMVERATERLLADGEVTGRVLVLPLHPYLVGQPFRIRTLEHVLARFASEPGVLVATADQVYEWFA
jgi:hypothetical protein